MSEPAGSYATIRMSRSLYDLLKLRLEMVGLAADVIDIGEELTKTQILECLEIAMGVLDVSEPIMRIWIESGHAPAKKQAGALKWPKADPAKA